MAILLSSGMSTHCGQFVWVYNIGKHLGPCTIHLDAHELCNSCRESRIDGSTVVCWLKAGNYYSNPCLSSLTSQYHTISNLLVGDWGEPERAPH